jgi:hypothetical protein
MILADVTLSGDVPTWLLVALSLFSSASAAGLAYGLLRGDIANLIKRDDEHAAEIKELQDRDRDHGEAVAGIRADIKNLTDLVRQLLDAIRRPPSQ